MVQAPRFNERSSDDHDFQLVAQWFYYVFINARHCLPARGPDLGFAVGGIHSRRFTVLSSVGTTSIADRSLVCVR
jgi:hypothetical protein